MGGGGGVPKLGVTNWAPYIYTYIYMYTHIHTLMKLNCNFYVPSEVPVAPVRCVRRRKEAASVKFGFPCVR